MTSCIHTRAHHVLAHTYVYVHAQTQTQTQSQTSAHVPPSPRRPSGKSMLQNSTLPSRSGSGAGSGGGASTEPNTNKATAPSSLTNSKAPSLPSQTTNDGLTSHRSRTAQTPSGAAYSIAAGGHQNSGVTVPVTTQLPAASVAGAQVNAHALAVSAPPQPPTVASSSNSVLQSATTSESSVVRYFGFS